MANDPIELDEACDRTLVEVRRTLAALESLQSAIVDYHRKVLEDKRAADRPATDG